MSSAGDEESDGGAGEEDETLAHFLESEILSVEDPILALKPPAKRARLEEEQTEEETPVPCPLPQAGLGPDQGGCADRDRVLRQDTMELFRHIFKFLSSEDLVSCSLVCKFMNFAASDECLWRRLYCIRWGLDSGIGSLRRCAWRSSISRHEVFQSEKWMDRVFGSISKLCSNFRGIPSKHHNMRVIGPVQWSWDTFNRDREDMVHFIRNSPTEFKEYYVQMQAAKRSQAPLPSQVYDDSVMLDKTVSEQVSIWKSKRGLTDELIGDHACSGDTCTYTQIGDVFVCEKTGRVHVCDDTCREIVLDQLNGHFEQGEIADEAEPFMGSGRFARAYCLGYNCDDEAELEAALRFC